MLTLPRAERPGELELCECPHCGSRYVHPTDWQAHENGTITLGLRCPECLARMRGTFCVARVRQLDRELAGGREALRALYARTVRRNMHAQLAALRVALDLDLIGADDFRPQRA